MAEWISVKDRLPTESGYYLVFLKDFEPSKWDDGDETIDCSHVTQFYYDSTQLLFIDDKYERYYNMALAEPPKSYGIVLTHWMPLPKPPIIEAEGEE